MTASLSLLPPRDGGPFGWSVDQASRPAISRPAASSSRLTMPVMGVSSLDLPRPLSSAGAFLEASFAFLNRITTRHAAKPHVVKWFCPSSPFSMCASQHREFPKWRKSCPAELVACQQQ